MAQVVKMPRFGQTMEEGTVVRWLKNPGDAVKVGEVLLEIETDKSVMEVESEFEGVILKRQAAEGDVLPCGQPLAWIGQPGDAIPDP